MKQQLSSYQKQKISTISKEIHKSNIKLIVAQSSLELCMYRSEVRVLISVERHICMYERYNGSTTK